MKATPIIVEQLFDTSIECLWVAVTKPDRMRQWLFAEIDVFRAEVGFETEFTVHAEGKDYVHQWKVVDVVPRQTLVYEWRYKGFPGDSSVTWQLTEKQGKAHLLLTHAGHETITGDDIFSYEHGLEGWRYLIQESLKNFLE